jgi:hypothetical protein
MRNLFAQLLFVLSALCVGAAMVVFVQLLPHWQAREPTWMVGGGLALLCSVFAAQVSFRGANRLAPDELGRAENSLDKLDELDKSFGAELDRVVQLAADAEARAMRTGDPDEMRASAQFHADMRVQRDRQRAAQRTAPSRAQQRAASAAAFDRMAWIIGIVVVVAMLELLQG